MKARQRLAEREIGSVRERAEADIDLAEARLRRASRPAPPQDHRGRAALA